MKSTLEEKETKIQELTSQLELQDEELQKRDTVIVEVQQKATSSETRIVTLLEEKAVLEETLDKLHGNLTAAVEQSKQAEERHSLELAAFKQSSARTSQVEDVIKVFPSLQCHSLRR